MTRYSELALLPEPGSKMVMVGGYQPDGLESGLYFRPTAFRAPNNSARICQEEVFGPFASTLVIDSIEEAIRVANDTEHKLVSYDWSNDHRAAMAATHAIEAGPAMVNAKLFSLDSRAPFGGFKPSGVGRERAKGSRAFYTEEKTVAFALKPPQLAPIGIN